MVGKLLRSGMGVFTMASMEADELRNTIGGLEIRFPKIRSALVKRELDRIRSDVASGAIPTLVDKEIVVECEKMEQEAEKEYGRRMAAVNADFEQTMRLATQQLQQALQSINPDQITPIEALQQIVELKKRYLR